jgi:hypothetical protein
LARIEDFNPERKILGKTVSTKLCQIDGNVPATKIIKLKYGFFLLICQEHLEELKEALKE